MDKEKFKPQKLGKETVGGADEATVAVLVDAAAAAAGVELVVVTVEKILEALPEPIELGFVTPAAGLELGFEVDPAPLLNENAGAD